MYIRVYSGIFTYCRFIHTVSPILQCLCLSNWFAQWYQFLMDLHKMFCKLDKLRLGTLDLSTKEMTKKKPRYKII